MNIAFKIHDETTAPAKALPLLEATRAKLRFIPNLLGGMSESPQVAETFMSLTQVAKTLSLSPQEREIVITVISKENGCNYCVANHTMVAEQLKIEHHIMNAIKSGEKIEIQEFESLRKFVLEAMNRKGKVSEATQADFFASGYTQAQALEVMLLIGIYTISNFSNGLMQVPVDKVFEPYLGLRNQG